MRSKVNKHAWMKYGAWALALLVTGLFVVWAIQLAQTVLLTQEHLTYAQSIAHSSESFDPVVACALVQDLQGDVAALHGQVGRSAQLAPALGWLPGVGGDLRAIPHLLTVAGDLTEAGTLVCDAMEPMMVTLGGTDSASGDFSLEQMAHILTERQGDLKRALVAVERAQGAWAQVDTGHLSPWMAEKTALLEEGLPLLRASLESVLIAPDLLGMDDPKNYLILAQNEDELRPTGGFISGAGQLTLDGGRIAELSFIDAYAVDDWAHNPHPEPPEPLFKYMRSELWLFRDANWSPDFPTSARQAAYFYKYGQGVSIDGVIAVDQRAVELLMSGLGEVHVPGIAQPVTGNNVREFMHAAWNPGAAGVTRGWFSGRKEFMGQLAAAIWKRVENDPTSVDWAQVAKALYRALEGRHLLFFADNADLTSVLAQVGWDGAVRESRGDYLMIVDANLGFGKTNPLISEEVDYRAVLRADGTATAELTVTYTHLGKRENVRCEHLSPYAGDLTYEALMHRCYYDYLRVYVPAGSVLRAATAHPTPSEYFFHGEPDDGQAVTLSDEAGKTVFAQFFVVEYGQTLMTRFEYDLPRVARSSEGQWHHTLLIQKQPGTDSTPISLAVVLPPGARPLTAIPAPQIVDGQALKFELEVDADTVVEVIYES